MAPKSNSPVPPANGTVVTDSPFARMLRDMAALATAEDNNAAFMGDAIAAIYNAGDDDDVWDADMSGPLNAQHLAGCELEFYDLQVKYGRGGTGTDGKKIETVWIAPDGKQMYLLVTAARISNAGAKKHVNLPALGEQFQLNTSAQFLAAKLFTFYVRGKFGNGKSMRGAIQSTDLGAGQAVLKLVRVPERAVNVQGTVEDVPLGEPPF